MKNFFRLVLKFLGLFFTTALLFILVVVYFVNKAGIKIDKTKNILILGDSHTECAIDDEIISRSANFSESGSTYFYSLLKLKQVLKNNKQIDTLLLSFHFGSLDIDNEKEYLYNEAYNFERLPKFVPFLTSIDLLSYYDKVLLVKSTLYSPVHYSSFIFKGLLSGNYQTSLMKLGKFNATDRNKLHEDLQFRKNNNIFKFKTDFSETELGILNEIASICKNSQVKLILINTPVFQAKKYTDVSFYERFKANSSDKFDFLDLSGFNPGDDGFGDVSHLNKKGALLFSIFLNQELKKY